MDPWLSLCEQVDKRLNRLAVDAAVGAAPEDAVAGLQAGLKALAKMLRGTIWPGIDVLAKAVDQVATEITSPNDASPALAHVQEQWNEYPDRHGRRGLDARVARGAGERSRRAAHAGRHQDRRRDAGEPAGVDRARRDRLVRIARPAPLTPEQQAIDDAEDLDVLRSDSELATMFISEALDHLSTIEATVLQLESDPTDQKLLNDVFRPFHTVKGNAGALSVKSVQEFAHKVENLLDLARGGSLTIGPEEIELILESVDMLTGMISALNTRLAGQPWDDRRQERAVLAAQIERVTSFGNARRLGGRGGVAGRAVPKSSRLRHHLVVVRAVHAGHDAAAGRRASGRGRAASRDASRPRPPPPPAAVAAMPKAVPPPMPTRRSAARTTG